MSEMDKSVILADDDSDDCVFFEEALNEVSSETLLTRAVDGLDLMNILARHVPPPPKLIFLDLNMPRKNGFECLTEIRSTSSLRDIPVIILTTSCEKESINKMYEQGADYYICKPESFEALKSAIAKVLAIDWLHGYRRPSREQFQITA
jgi:CheY-like chemotaxis protein